MVLFGLSSPEPSRVAICCSTPRDALEKELPKGRDERFQFNGMKLCVFGGNPLKHVPFGDFHLMVSTSTSVSAELGKTPSRQNLAVASSATLKASSQHSSLA